MIDEPEPPDYPEPKSKGKSNDPPSKLAMKPSLVAASAVIVAHQFNPSIVSQLWLVENGVVSKDDFEPNVGNVFSDMMANVVTKQFGMLVTPEQIQFSPKQAPPNGDLLGACLGRLVETLPHTPYTACGLNFTWFACEDDLGQRSKRMFFVGNSDLHRAFDVDGARFGGYMSKQWNQSRLKLDVKPAVVRQGDNVQKELLQFSFNFHRDVDPKSKTVDSVVAHLQLWNEAFDETQEIMSIVCKGESS